MIIEPTDEMEHAMVYGGPTRERLAAVLAIVERDYGVYRRPTAEELASRPQPTRRLRACVENWPDCYEGGYDPHCCRWPKSCSATVYDEDRVTDDDLEPVDTAPYPPAVAG